MSDANRFIPLSNQLGIPGSSYRVQMGKVNGKWAVRLARGNEVLDSKIFYDQEEDEPPNANAIVGWVIQTLPIPNLNPYQIAKSVGFIRQEAIRNNERAKKKAAVPIQEAKGVKLEAIPEDAKRKLEMGKQKLGWVKESSTAPQTSTKTSAAAVATEEKKRKTRRALPTIPTGNAASAPQAAASSKKPLRGSYNGEGTYIIKVPPGTKRLIIEFEEE